MTTTQPQEHPMDLTTATPVQVDEALAEIYGRYFAALATAETVQGWIDQARKHDADGEAGKLRGYWTPTDPARLASYQAKLEAAQATADAIIAEARPYDAEFGRRGGWTRFFLVQDGHVHSSQACHTCNKGKRPTKFGWLPDWSGQTEKEAIEGLRAQGGEGKAAMLCTECFPNAPVAWTTKPVDDSKCTGHRDYDAPSRQGYYTGNWATCTCGQRITTTSTGKLRAHKKP